MRDTEAHTLRRASIALLLLSAARWGWGAWAEPAPLPDDDVLEELLAESRAAEAESERRSAPLAPGERVDPNRADEGTLDRLPGVGPAIAAAVVAARDTGSVYRTPSDLLVVRGIGPRLLSRLEPLLDLTRPPPSARAAVGRSRVSGRSTTPHPEARVRTIDVNRALAAELELLPGVGPVLAERIAAARAERPFASVDDLTRVPGIGPATVERLRGLVTVASRW